MGRRAKAWIRLLKQRALGLNGYTNDYLSTFN